MISSINRNSPVRMTGLSSGLDTSAIIQQAMRLNRMKIDSMMRARTTLQWKREMHSSVRDQLSSFRNSFLTTLGPNAMLSSSVYNTAAAEVTGKNSSAVTVRTGPGSEIGSLSINSISKLAQGARAVASNVSGDSALGISSNTRLGDILGSDFDGGMEVTIAAGGEEKTVTLSKDMTVGEMINAVNQSGAGVTMTFDRLGDELRVETNETRVDGRVQSREGETLTLSGKVFEALGLISAAHASAEDGISAVADGRQTFSNAQNAELTVNNQVITSNSNTFDFRGINLTLNETFDDEGPGTDSAVGIAVKRDVTEALDKIKSFVAAYNGLIHRLENLLVERKTKDESTYIPLTEEEKAHMTEKQVEEWEAIAKKGLLRGDGEIQSLVNNLRRALFDSVSAAGLSPSQIGLTTGSFFAGTGSQIVLNEDRLRAALEQDPEKVMNVFMSGGLSSDYNQRGLLYRINDAVGNYLNRSSVNTLERLESSIMRTNTQMERLQDKMWREEDRLYRRYAAMETSLSKLQSQGDWLTQMLEGFNK